jgi:hypothetical protein
MLLTKAEQVSVEGVRGRQDPPIHLSGFDLAVFLGAFGVAAIVVDTPSHFCCLRAERPRRLVPETTARSLLLDTTSHGRPFDRPEQALALWP